jgi:tripartite-type tricarboxylate transporter receptor subunit TctC
MTLLLNRLLLCLALSPGIALAQTAAEFYTDRTVTILVGSGAGGATDISARVIAQYLGEYIPGRPTVVVVNMPGGGSVTMTNHVYRSASKDGSTLGYSLPGVITAQLLEPRRARYDGRELNWIGSALKYTGIISVVSTAPAVTIEQARETEVFIGTTGRGSPAFQFPAIAQALLGLKFNLIAGYESSNDVALAMERGEVHGQSSSLEYWAISRPDWLTNGRISHLLYVGPPDPLGMPGVPYLGDLVTSDEDKALVDFIEIGSTMGWPLFAPPGVPAERIDALQAAFASLVENPEFAEAFESTVKGKLDPTTGDDLTAYVRRALDTSPATLAAAKTILGID